MADYDINGTLFYNLRLLHKSGAFAKTHLAAMWLALLDAPADADERAALIWRERLKNARQLARSGVVHALAVQPGRLAARIEHPISKAMHSVRILASRADDATWDAVADVAARTAETAAAIAHNALPAAVVQPLLLAREAITLEADGAMLPHAAPPDPLLITPWLVFAERLDDDPWLWLLFRGQTQDGLLDLMQQRSRAQVAGIAPSELNEALPFNHFWVMGSAPAIAPQGTDNLSPVMRRLAGHSAGLRMGRRSLAAALRKAYSTVPPTRSIL
jgi:hypothetical protein